VPQWGEHMITVESDVVIQKPVEEVFAFVSERSNESKWHTDIVEVRPAPDSRGSPGGNLSASWTLGSTWLVTVKFMGRKEYLVEITGVELNRQIQFTTLTGPVRPITTYLFETAPGGTRFIRHVEIPLHGVLRAMKPLMRKSVEKRNARFVENLKRLLEQ